MQRGRDPADRHRHSVVLTDAGRRRLRDATRTQRSVEDTLFAALDDDKQRIQRILIAVRDDLTAGDDSCGTPMSLERADHHC